MSRKKNPVPALNPDLAANRALTGASVPTARRVSTAGAPPGTRTRGLTALPEHTINSTTSASFINGIGDKLSTHTPNYGINRAHPGFDIGPHTGTHLGAGEIGASPAFRSPSQGIGKVSRYRPKSYSDISFKSGQTWKGPGKANWLAGLENMSGARMLRYGGAVGAGIGAINRAGRALDSARNGRMGGALANGAFAAGLAYTAYDLGIARGAMAQHLGRVAGGWASKLAGNAESGVARGLGKFLARGIR